MAKFCGKCGSRLDEATGLCPNCDAEKIKESSAQEKAIEIQESKQEVVQVSEESLSKKDIKKKRKADKNSAPQNKKKEKHTQWSTGKKIRHFFLKLALTILLLLTLATGVVCSLTYFGFIQNSTIIRAVENLGVNRESDIARLFGDFANEYQVVSENEDGTYTLKILAPDFTNILKQEIETNPTLTLNLENLELLIEKYPDLKKNYEFTAASKKQDDIQKAFLQHISYDLMVAAIADTPISEPQKQEVKE